MIYLDNAATSWPKPESVYKAVEQTLREVGNAGRGASSKSLAASRILLEARNALADFFNISASERVVFTQNVTESLNLALKGFLSEGEHVVISPFEHNSVVRVLEYLKMAKGVSYSIANINRDKINGDNIDRLNNSNFLKNPELVVEAFANALQNNTKLICTTHASNVVGSILPITELGRLAKSKDVLFMVDVAQTAGVIPINAQEMNIDLLAFTGHKGLLGTQGTGGLYIRPGIDLEPLIHGGTGSQSALLKQPTSYPEAVESGTRNIPGIAGLLAGVTYCKQNMEHMRAHEQMLTNLFIKFCLEHKQITIYGPIDEQARVGLVAFNVDGIRADELAFRLEREYGVTTRTGLHCAPLAHELISTLECGAVRMSVGAFTTEQEIQQLINALEEIIC
ncbi:aminotransferase class V-fold PLP-dependent enzyme [Desulfuribacillus alkaliarsenatis]|uniref:cysteine desulfurase n=1 Tax=Desulfuribacillus alkaliarsenatis TaxID=766136 RepID=A0A1E5FZR0_9FIRM|nr:aminotransferase class V-fold PLP-dependent enzyme [Desulfuribacillus alkaliarsenatis]OEF95928.1 hypothetical protein BHF68_11095 [Desulfuribacillus alkaliarsenatis]